MEHIDARAVLDMVADFQTKAEKVVRYEKNPYVQGDSVAEHLARMTRLLVYIAPYIQAEFSDKPSLVQEILVCLTVHDDDEVIAGFDIATAIKVHDVHDGEEIQAFTKAVSVLPEQTSTLLVDAFSSFRNKSSLAAKIAKALDNIVGNQLVIEQGFGLINPDSARFSIEYGKKVSGVSKTIDTLIEAQIEQILEFRKKARRLLEIDVSTHVLDQSKVYTPIDQL